MRGRCKKIDYYYIKLREARGKRQSLDWPPIAISSMSVAPGMSPEERAPYVLICCLSTGAPWSEQKPGTEYDIFMADMFGNQPEGGIPSQGQDM